LQFRNTETKFRLHQQLTGVLMLGNKKLNETQRAPVIWQRGSVMGALSHLQIVEIGSAAAASYCTRWP